MLMTGETYMSNFYRDDLKQVYKEGYNAYLDGKISGSNPYNGDEEEEKWNAWKEGYTDAGWDD